MSARAVGLAMLLVAVGLSGCGSPDDSQASQQISEQTASSSSTPGSPDAVVEPDTRARQVTVPDLPRPLNAGSCRLYPPTGEPRGLTVFLDPGHGGYDPGAGGQTSSGQVLDEASLSLAVARRAGSDLRADGYAVVLSRTTDANVISFRAGDVNGDVLTAEAVRNDVLARAACANAADADALLSIHFNSYGDPAIGGTQTLYAPNRTFGASSERLANLVQASAAQGFHDAGWEVRDRGVVRDIDVEGQALTVSGAEYGNLLILGPLKAGHNERPSEMPGAVTELLFLSSPAEADIASSPRGQQVMASAIVGGVEEFFSADR